ncbi:hypothetical protein BOA8489_01472 [Boseongicola aestuarii]|uniref:Uncharacterized protein n=1 Tax=Boseongicola aestuarii TaxID=1470561 RepID=A0A238IY98_9RHOB|nr:hypothetical protein BOA8489_01472 [Boseongicola aestuarii]
MSALGSKRTFAAACTNDRFGANRSSWHRRMLRHSSSLDARANKPASRLACTVSCDLPPCTHLGWLGPAL